MLFRPLTEETDGQNRQEHASLVDCRSPVTMRTLGVKCLGYVYEWLVATVHMLSSSKKGPPNPATRMSCCS
jgi:hypothetical protein